MTTIVIDTVTGKITGSTSTVPVGAFMSIMRASPPEGWVAGDGGTIGPVGSGATRANPDTQDLYFAWWADFTDAVCPMLTVAGAPSARGASAMVDWAAGKRMTVFDVRGRFPRAAGTINGLTFAKGFSYADMFQGHWHEGQASVSGATGSPYSSIMVGAAGSLEGLTSRSFKAVTPITDTANGTPRYGLETAPVSIAMLGCFKL